MGGAERWLISLARCCDRRRVEWVGTALSLGGMVHPDLCREMSAYMPIYAGPEAGALPCPDCIRSCSSARAALQTVLEDADVLITWGLPQLRDLLEGYDRPVILVSHGDGGGEWGRRTIRSSESGATHLVAVSEAASQAFSPECRDRVAILPNGVDVQRCTATVPRQEMREAWGFAEHHRLIGYVGRYSVEKNPMAAAWAVNHLGGDYRAVYAGSGWQEAEVRRQVQKIAGSRACFVPMDRHVGNVLSGLDLFLLASPSEGFSLALAEAWYCSVPAAATRVGAVPELERLHGTLVSPVPIRPSAEELAQAIEYALTPTFRREIVTWAHEAVAQNYTAGAMARRWSNYLSAVRGGSRMCDLN
jgi:glycosyltransferase involved in cell wall biosynthesis